MVTSDDRSDEPLTSLYFSHEVRLMIAQARFSDIEMRGDHSLEAPTRDSMGVVFIARKPG